MRYISHRLLIIDFSLLMMLLVAIPFCGETKRRSTRYLIPAGYTGWVKINFGVPGAPVLPVEDDHYVAQISPDGSLKTSSNIEYGNALDEYYFLEGANRQRIKLTTFGGGGMIWGQFNGQGSNSSNQAVETYLLFFVGPEEEFKKHPTPPK